MTPFRLVPWLPLAWWGWWAAALPCFFVLAILWHYRCILSKIKRVLVPLNQTWSGFYVHGCLKFHCGFASAGRRLHGHVWNDGGDDGKRGERRAVSHYQSVLNFPNKTGLGAADPLSNNCVCLCCLCLQERMTGAPNCQTFSSSTVISYSSSDAGAPKVYQQTSQTTTGPGGVRISNREAFTILRFLLFPLRKQQLFLLVTDPRDTAVAQGQREWARASRHRPPHRPSCTHNGAVTEPSHWRSRGTPRLH